MTVQPTDTTDLEQPIETPTATPPRRVVVIGCGCIGLPAVLLAAAAGHTVVAFDIDRNRVRRLSAADPYVPGITTRQLRAALDTGRLAPTDEPDDLAGFDVALIAVPTPTEGDRPDLRSIEAASRTIAQHVRPGVSVILECTTYPGTTEDIVVPILETSGFRAGNDFHVGYAPERINPGTPVAAIAAVPKIVAGIDDASRAAVAAFWSGLVEHVVLAPDLRTAELAKLIENAFRLLNISFVNDLVRSADALGADVWEALRLAESKPYGYMGFRPGVGAGGHCLPSDTRYLAWSIRETTGTATALLDAAVAVNDDMPGYVARRILAGLEHRGHHPRDARVVVVGVTYKPDVADLRESCALRVVEELRERGAAVTVIEPHVTDDPDIESELTAGHVENASVVALLVAHRDLDYQLIATAPYVFDACNVISPAANIERL